MNAPVISNVTSAQLLSCRLTTGLAALQRHWRELIASLFKRYRHARSRAQMAGETHAREDGRDRAPDRSAWPIRALTQTAAPSLIRSTGRCAGDGHEPHWRPAQRPVGGRRRCNPALPTAVDRGSQRRRAGRACTRGDRPSVWSNAMFGCRQVVAGAIRPYSLSIRSPCATDYKIAPTQRPYLSRIVVRG